MGDKINWLITILNRDQLLKCALRVKREKITIDCIMYPMEPKNKEHIRGLLPLHVRNCGPIVEVEEIFEVTVVE